MVNTKPEDILCLKDHWLENHSKLFQQTFADQLPVYKGLVYVPGDSKLYNIVSIRGKAGQCRGWILQYLIEWNSDGWKKNYDLGELVSVSIYLAGNKCCKINKQANKTKTRSASCHDEKQNRTQAGLLPLRTYEKRLLFLCPQLSLDLQV